MALCKDQSLTYLNKFGYNVVRLPRTGINPLDVIGKDKGEFTRLGSLARIWSSSVEVPKTCAAQEAANISGMKTDNIKLSFGLKILGNILSALGVNVPSLEASYQKTNTLQFTLGNVSLISIDPFEINNYMAKGTLTTGPLIERYFNEEEDTRTFLITEILLANEITVSANNKSGESVAIDVTTIKKELEGKVEVSVSGEEKTEITYKGTKQLVFGFKSFEIIWKDRWILEGVGRADFLEDGVNPVIVTPEMRMLIRELDNVG